MDALPSWFWPWCDTMQHPRGKPWHLCIMEGDTELIVGAHGGQHQEELYVQTLTFRHGVVFGRQSDNFSFCSVARSRYHKIPCGIQNQIITYHGSTGNNTFAIHHQLENRFIIRKHDCFIIRKHDIHRILFLKVRLIVTKHWFRLCLGAE